MKMKVFSLLLIAAGLLIIVYGGWKIYDTNRQTGDSLTDAKKAVAAGGSLDGSSAESFKPAMGEAVGILYIPRLKAELPIVEGTSADDRKRRRPL